MANYVQFGLLFGFPKCCIKSFMSGMNYSTRPDLHNTYWDGTGFCPCVDCSKRPVSEVVSEIQKNRILETPFPHMPPFEVIEKLAEKLPKTLDDA